MSGAGSFIPVAKWDYELTLLQCANILDAMGQPAILRRGIAPNTMDRPCRVFFRKHNVREMMGGLVDPMERRVIMSARGLTAPPDVNVDSLVTFVQPFSQQLPLVENESYRITKPPEPVGPAGLVVIWRLWVRR